VSASNQGVETKVAVGSTTTIVAGYIAWALVTYVPGLNDTFPLDLQGQLPVVVAFVLSAVAAYFAPHTHRAAPDPGLLIPEQVPPAAPPLNLPPG
jgi:hypothetical protein